MSKKTIKLGNYHGKPVYFDMGAAMNKHSFIIGKSGGGKSVQAQKMIAELVEKGETVIAFDLHSVLSDDQIFSMYRDRFMAHVHEIDVYHEGISCDLFSSLVFEDGEKEQCIDTVGAILDVIARTRRLGSKQHATLRKALLKVCSEDAYGRVGFMALDTALLGIGTSVSETIREKLYPLTAHNVFRPGKFFIERGKINILRLSKFDMDTQETIVEVVLAYLWRLATASKFKDDGIFIFVDEMQNLGTQKGCALSKILDEGRKFNVNLILATQQLALTSRSSVQQSLLQCGLILFFQPNTAQINTIARLIDPQNADAWSYTLRTLKKGEFIASGTLVVGEISTETPLKVSARALEKEAAKVENRYYVNGVAATQN